MVQHALNVIDIGRRGVMGIKRARLAQQTEGVVRVLTFHNTRSGRLVPGSASAQTIPPGTNWIDAYAPDAAEIDLLRRTLSIEVPTLQKMVEIETSSRLYRVGDTLFLTVPIASHGEDGSSQSKPLAFVVTRDVLLTVRFDPVKLCDARSGAVETNDPPVAGGIGALIALIEALVDHIADDLESVTSRLDALSHSIFADPVSRPMGRPPATDKNLRRLLTRIGRVRGFTSLISETLLVLMRLSRYVASEAADRLDAPARARLDRIAHDSASLNDHEARLSEKIQFLLDATLGLIGVDQNDIFKILTMVSVVGIPPTLLASMYGMNFKTMPEYDWAYGYAYGLFMISMSALIPLLWFKWRRWW